MPRGVAARRAITAADVTAREAKPQMDPAHSRPEALFTPRSPGRSRFDFDDVLTVHGMIPQSSAVSIRPSRLTGQAMLRSLLGEGHIVSPSQDGQVIDAGGIAIEVQHHGEGARFLTWGALAGMLRRRPSHAQEGA
jgi:hypothetical protein